jgi:hypothetical protein
MDARETAIELALSAAARHPRCERKTPRVTRVEILDSGEIWVDVSIRITGAGRSALYSYNPHTDTFTCIAGL